MNNTPLPMIKLVSFLFLSSVRYEVLQASLSIALKPIIHFSYSSRNLSSMYFLIFSFACCLRCPMSLHTMDLSTCSIRLFLTDWSHLCLTSPLLWLYAIQSVVASSCSFVAFFHARIFVVLHVCAYIIFSETKL